MKSISPALKAAICVTGSLIVRITTRSSEGSPGSKYLSKRSMTRCAPFAHSTSLKGPQPTSASGFPARRSSGEYFCVTAGEMMIIPMR